MKRRGGAFGAAAALTLALAGCDPSGRAPAVEADSATAFVDADGHELRITLPVRRVVSLVPSATLTLDALGARSALVARTDYDTAPWAAPLPSVGGGLEPSLEAIVAARPELVIRFAGPQDARTPARLDELGIPHLAVRPDGVEDVLAMIRTLGRLTGRAPEADALAGGIEAELEAVRAEAEGAAPVTVAYVIGGDPPWVAGPGTYLDELIRLAGGTNAFADLDALYAAVNPEEFVARDIDVVLLSKATSFDRRLVGDARIVQVGEQLELPGPGMAEAARRIRGILRETAR